MITTVGNSDLNSQPVHHHAAFTLSFIVDTLESKGLLTSEVVQSVKTFVTENQTTAAVAGKASVLPIVVLYMCHTGTTDRGRVR